MENGSILESEIIEDETVRACLSSKVLSTRYIVVTESFYYSLFQLSLNLFQCHKLSFKEEKKNVIQKFKLLVAKQECSHG